MPSADWSGIADLIESVAGAPELVAEAVDEVRSSSREMASLEVGDVAGHTRGLLLAATRAIRARRGPTDVELSFIEDLAVTRARQGIPVEAVLSAIHVAERRIWAAARALAEAQGVDPTDVLDARELYDDWAEAVRLRLIVAHRRAAAGALTTGPDRAGVLLRRLLDGGSAAALAAAEAGLRPSAVTVLVVPGVAPPERSALVAELRRRGVAGAEGTSVVGVLSGAIGDSDSMAATLSGQVVGLAGPGPAEETPTLRRLAATTADAAGGLGLLGPTHVSEVAVPVALAGRGDLGAALLERHRAGIDALGRTGLATVETVRRWVELGQDTERTAAELYVHPNTVRNRVNALTRATGLVTTAPLEAVTLWWICRAWERRDPPPR